MEIWIDIPKYEDYRVSNTGKIESRKNKKPKLLKPLPHSDGRFRVGLRRYEKTKYLYIHKIVYCAFNGLPLSTKISIIHLDKNKANNNLDNLQSIEFKEASKYRYE